MAELRNQPPTFSSLSPPSSLKMIGSWGPIPHLILCLIVKTLSTFYFASLWQILWPEIGKVGWGICDSCLLNHACYHMLKVLIFIDCFETLILILITSFSILIFLFFVSLISNCDGLLMCIWTILLTNYDTIWLVWLLDFEKIMIH